MGTDYEYDKFAEAHYTGPRIIWWVLWLVWVALTFLGFTVGQTLGSAVEGLISPQLLTLPTGFSLAQPVERVGDFAIVPVIAGGLVAGMVLAVAQGIVLLPFLRVAGVAEWAIATTIGRAVGWVAVYITARSMVGLVFDRQVVGLAVLSVFLVGMGIIVGWSLGYAQGMVLRRRVPHPTWWVYANLSGPLMVAILLVLVLLIAEENTIRDASTPLMGAIVGISTAIALVDLLRHGKQPNWITRMRPRNFGVEPVSDTVLGSSLYNPSTAPSSRPSSQQEK
jgi:hypothetical protein